MVGGILSWNMGCRDGQRIEAGVESRREAMLHALVKEIRPDLIALQEAPPTIHLDSRFQSVVSPQSTRLMLAFDKRSWTLQKGPNFYSTRAVGVILHHNLSAVRLWFWNIHGPATTTRGESGTSETLKLIAGHLRSLRAEYKAGSDHADIVAGDFNLCPFHDALVNEDGFNARRSLIWSRAARPRWFERGSVDGFVHDPTTVRGHPPLFNPMWEVLGQRRPPLGTFYTSSGRPGGPWYLLDQVLLSPELVPSDEDPVARVVDQVEDAGKIVSLCSATAIRTPRESVGSDHLPIHVRFELPGAVPPVRGAALALARK